MPDLVQRYRRWLLAAAAFLVSVGVTVVVTDNGPDHRPDQPRRTVTVTLGGPGHEKVPLTPAAQQIAAQQATEDAHGDDAAAESDLHEDAPPTPAAAAKAEAIKPAGQPEIPAHVPLATVHEPGCDTALVRNYSSRNGAPVLFGFLHWTGSRPTLGSPAGGLANVRWFDMAASQASSNYITDQDGRCWLTVAESQKAWTQANANSWTVSVEITNQGVMPLFQTPAARAVVIRLMRSWHRKWGIPYRHGIIRQGPPRPGSRLPTCIPVRSGFLSHRDGGACAGGHPDVGSFDVDGLIRQAAATPRPQVTPADRAACKAVRAYRDRRLAHKPRTASGTAAFHRRLALVKSHRLRCVDGKPRAR